MAQKISVELTDDTNGKTADETVTFGLDGREFEIDLTSKNAAALRKAFATYVQHGRRVGGRRPRGASPKAAGSNGTDTRAVREWASKNGHTVSDRGRIPNHVLEAYKAAQG